jgi:antitoxin MazE
MRVSKWGNSLAVRLPATVVDALALKDGDQVEIEIGGRRRFAISKDPEVERALAQIRRLRRPLPRGFRFSRQDANER